MFGSVQTAKMQPLSQKASQYIVIFTLSPNLVMDLSLALLKLGQILTCVGSQEIY